MLGEVTVLCGDCREVLKTLPANSVNCCITSPPYYGLRDYGTAKWEGGDENCVHSVGNQVPDKKAEGAITCGVRPGCDAYICKKCGAKRVDSQIGLEQTPEEYVNQLVLVFREVRRVLRDDGVCWVNLGDSYSGSGKGCGAEDHGKLGKHANEFLPNKMSITKGLKAKDLIGIPWMVAFALRTDGWYLRQDIIWNKNNAMPESVQDRCTKSHEYVFCLQSLKNIILIMRL